MRPRLTHIREPACQATRFQARSSTRRVKGRIRSIAGARSRFLLLGGRAADLLGRRRVLMVGLFVFTVSSLGCGLATADSFLIPMRFLQGLGAAIVLPAALSI